MGRGEYAQVIAEGRTGKVAVVAAIEHTLLRKGVIALLSTEPEFSVVGEAGSVEESIDLVRRGVPDLLILNLPNRGSSAVLGSIRDLADRVRTVVIAADTNASQIAEAYELGARAVLLRGAGADTLFDCIRHVSRGGYWHDRSPRADLADVTRKMPERASSAGAARNFGLTPREREILAAVVYGQTNVAIARRLSISEQTVKHHLSSIFDKFGVCNRLELALFATHHGLVTQPPAPVSELPAKRKQPRL